MRSWLRMKTVCLVLILALVLSLAPAVLAEGDAELYLEGGNVNGNVLQLVFYSSADETPSAENVSVQLDGQPIAVKSVNPLSYADPGTSYYLLFDTNTTVIERALPDMQKIARTIADGMDAQDNAIIVAMGEKAGVKDFSDDQDEINAKIDALKRGTETQDLYSSIYNALDLLSGSEGLRARKCLIVMADGLDSQISGISEMELSSFVENAQIPICVVALTYNTKTEKRVEAAKTIAGFSRLSPAGLNVLLTTGGAEDAANQILARKEKTYLAVLEADAVRAITQAEQVDVTVTMTVGIDTLTCERKLSLAGLADTQLTPEPAATPIAVPEPAATALPTLASTINAAWHMLLTLPIWVYWAASVAVFLIVALLIILAVLRSKRRKRRAVAGTIARFGPTSEECADLDAPNICIIRLGREEQICCEIRMPDKLVIGGDSKRAHLVLSGDPALSPTQCRLLWRDGKVWVEEMGKKQYTLLNGAPVEKAAAVRSGDVLRLGAFDYRIFWGRQ